MEGIEREDEGEMAPTVEDAEGLMVGEEGAVGAILEYDDDESVGDGIEEETVGEVWSDEVDVVVAFGGFLLLEGFG